MAGVGAFRIPQRVRDRWSGRVMTVGNGSCLPDGRQTPCLGPETGFPIAEPGMTPPKGGLLGIPCRPRKSRSKEPQRPPTQPVPNDRACCSEAPNPTVALVLASDEQFPPLSPGGAKDGAKAKPPGPNPWADGKAKQALARLQALHGSDTGIALGTGDFRTVFGRNTKHITLQDVVQHFSLLRLAKPTSSKEAYLGTGNTKDRRLFLRVSPVS